MPKLFSRKTDNERKGSILLMVLGILALLSMLGTALLFMARQEESNSHKYLEDTRAQFAAESGIETGLAKLSGLDMPLTNIVNATKFRPDNLTTPLKHLAESSFGQLNMDGIPGREVAGVVSSTFMQNGDNFKLRISSPQSRLNINDSNAFLNFDSDPYEDQRLPERNYADIPIHLQHPSGKDPDWAYPFSWTGQYNPDVNGDGSITSADADMIMQIFSQGNPTPAQLAAADLNHDGAVDNQDWFSVQNAIVESANNPYEAWRSPKGLPHPKGGGRLEGILKALLEVLFPGNTALAQNAPAKLMKTRASLPNAKFENMEQLRAILVPSLMNEADYLLFQSYLTLQSWQDSQILRPTFQWRISTPPRIDPNDPLSAHSEVIAADRVMLGLVEPNNQILWSALQFNLPLPPPRPGYTYANTSGNEENSLNGLYQYDYANDGSIDNHYDPNKPYFYDPDSDISTHNRDIYIYWDMQTRYFELDSRSPIDINSVPKELLEALIVPVQGWFLKEAPSTWEGEAMDSRAEDWSQFAKRNIYSPTHAFPWLSSLRCNRSAGFEPAVEPDSWGAIAAVGQWEDMQYYYYDAITEPCVDYDSLNDRYYLFCRKKSGRFGELAQSSYLTKIIAGESLAKKVAKAIYNRIHPDPNNDGIPDGYLPFTTWEEFEHFITDLADGDGINDLTNNPADFDIYMAHSLIANFNPNSRINDYNPDKRFFLHVDKSQLIQNTTELCFHPMGFYSIESLGQVYRTRKSIISTHGLRALVKPHEFFRITSQDKFLQGYSMWDGPKLKDYFSNSNGEAPTSGFPGYFNSMQSYAGASLQSYPEPEAVDWSDPGDITRNYIKDSRYDGYLTRAVWKPESGDLFDNGAGNTFYHVFYQSLLATSSNSILEPKVDSVAGLWRLDPKRPIAFNNFGGELEDVSRQVPANHPTVNALTRNLAQSFPTEISHSQFPGVLYPDGAFSDVGRSLLFDPNFSIGFNNGRRGALQYWLKPGFDVAHSNRIRKFTSLEREYNAGVVSLKDFSLYYFSRGGRRVVRNAMNELSDDVNLSYRPDFSMNSGEWLPTRSLYLGFMGTNMVPDAIGSSSVNQSWRLDPVDPDDVPNPAGAPLYNFETRQWSCIAFQWSNLLPLDKFSLAINGKFVPEDRGEFNQSGSELSMMNCWKEPDNSKVYTRFGGSSSSPYMGKVADSTYDVIVSSENAFSPNACLVQEFTYGRYYAENDATYISPNFDLFNEVSSKAGKLTLHSVAWTGYWPKSPNANKFANHPLYNDNLDANNSDYYIPVKGIAKSVFSLPGETVYPDDPMKNVWANCPGLNIAMGEHNWRTFSVDFADRNAGFQLPGTDTWRYASLNATPEKKPYYAGGSMDPNWKTQPLFWKKGQSFRFKVHFLLEEGQTLLATPVFDDITFCFKPDKEEVLLWEILED